MSDSIVRLKNVDLYHGAQHVLRDISLEIKKGEYLTIVGPNGAGKTSLLKLIAGMYKAHSGSIHKISGLRIGYVPQKIHIDPRLPLTVRDFLETIAHHNPAHIGMDVDHVLRTIKSESLASTRIGTLSGGQLQKIAIAQALMNHPHCILLDEPMAHLDTQERDRMLELIQRLYKEIDCTMIVVSHDVRMVAAYAQRVVCLHHHICCTGKPADISSHPVMEKYFGPYLAPYPHQHNGCHHHTG